MDVDSQLCNVQDYKMWKRQSKETHVLRSGAASNCVFLRKKVLHAFSVTTDKHPQIFSS